MSRLESDYESGELSDSYASASRPSDSDFDGGEILEQEIREQIAAEHGMSTEPSIEKLPDSPKNRTVPDAGEMAELRKPYWREQGSNDRGYLGTCALATAAGALSELTGRQVTESEVVEFAAERGLCTTEEINFKRLSDGSHDPTWLGATRSEDTCRVIREMGREADVKADIDYLSLESLAQHVDSGDIVLAEVRADAYWPVSEDPELDTLLHDADNLGIAGPDHMVWVTAVRRDPESAAPTAFYINDAGHPDGAGMVLSDDQMRAAFRGPGATAGGAVIIVTRKDRT